MTHYCKICDKTINQSSKTKHFKTKIHKTLETSIIRRYVILNPDFDEIREIVRKYVNLYTKKYHEFYVYCLFKTLSKSNTIKYIRLPIRHYVQYLYICTNLQYSVMKKIDKEKDNISSVYQMRITFVGNLRFMT